VWAISRFGREFLHILAGNRVDNIVEIPLSYTPQRVRGPAKDRLPAGTAGAEQEETIDEEMGRERTGKCVALSHCKVAGRLGGQGSGVAGRFSLSASRRHPLSDRGAFSIPLSAVRDERQISRRRPEIIRHQQYQTAGDEENKQYLSHHLQTLRTTTSFLTDMTTTPSTQGR